MGVDQRRRLSTGEFLRVQATLKKWQCCWPVPMLTPTAGMYPVATLGATGVHIRPEHQRLHLLPIEQTARKIRSIGARPWPHSVVPAVLITSG